MRGLIQGINGATWRTILCPENLPPIAQESIGWDSYWDSYHGLMVDPVTSRVATWTDRVSEYVLAAEANVPVYSATGSDNGKPALVFTAANQEYLKCTTAGLIALFQGTDTPISVLSRCKVANNSTWSVVCNAADVASDTLYASLWRRGDASHYTEGAFTRRSATTLYHAYGTLATTETNFGGTYDGTWVKAYTPSYGTPVSFPSRDYSAVDHFTVGILQRLSGLVYPLDGTIECLAIKAGELTAGQVAAVFADWDQYYA